MSFLFYLFLFGFAWIDFIAKYFDETTSNTDDYISWLYISSCCDISIWSKFDWLSLSKRMCYPTCSDVVWVPKIHCKVAFLCESAMLLCVIKSTWNLCFCWLIPDGLAWFREAEIGLTLWLLGLDFSSGIRSFTTLTFVVCIQLNL